MQDLSTYFGAKHRLAKLLLVQRWGIAGCNINICTLAMLKRQRSESGLERPPDL